MNTSKNVLHKDAHKWNLQVGHYQWFASQRNYFIVSDDRDSCKTHHSLARLEAMYLYMCNFYEWDTHYNEKTAPCIGKPPQHTKLKNETNKQMTLLKSWNPIYMH